MKDRQVNIELLQQYINGDVTAKQALYVEQQLSTSEQWQDVYEGLLFAKEVDIDTEQTVSELFDELQSKDSKKKVIDLYSWKQWALVAASLAGILFISYATIYFLSPTSTDESGYEVTRTTPSRPQDFHPTNEIEIIDTKAESEAGVKKQSFSSEEIKRYPKQPTVEREMIEPEHILIDEGMFPEPQKMDSFIAKRGYRTIQYNREVTENKNNRVIQRHAQPSQGIEAFEKENTQNYILRFPFNGIVEIVFSVNEKGVVTTYDVLNSSNSEATEAVVALITDETTWKAAVDEDGEHLTDRLRIKVSFGNTNYIQLHAVE